MSKIYKTYAGVEGIKVNKNGKAYVSNPILLKEIIKSKEQDKLTDDAVKMLTLLAENIATSRPFPSQDDKDDCIAGALLDCLKYWRSFDPTKSSNPFAYFTSVCTNGILKVLRSLGYHNFPKSKMISFDNDNIHSL